MKRFLTCLFVFNLFFDLVWAETGGVDPENALVYEGEIHWGNYTARKTLTDEAAKITVLKGKKVIKEIDLERTPSGASKDGSDFWNKYGFVRLLNSSDEQLILRGYSGGAHCCEGMTIFSLGEQLSEIYGGSGEIIKIIDFDGDGTYEIYADVSGFDYVGSRGGQYPPMKIYSYDPKEKQYVLSNIKFAKYLLDTLQKQIEEYDTEKLKYPDSLHRQIIEILLGYIYLGQREKGWDFFEREYNYSNKDEIRKQVKSILETEEAYNAIYGK